MNTTSREAEESTREEKQQEKQEENEEQRGGRGRRRRWRERYRVKRERRKTEIAHQERSRTFLASLSRRSEGTERYLAKDRVEEISRACQVERRTSSRIHPTVWPTLVQPPPFA